MILNACPENMGEYIAACADVCIPSDLAKLTTLVYNIIRIVVPLVLIIIGMVDMARAMIAKNQDEVKKAQQLLVKKAIAGAIVFLLLSLILWSVDILSSTSETDKDKGIVECINALFNNGD